MIEAVELKEKKPLYEDCGPWKVTAEQIEQIRAKDINAISKFYFDNYGVLSNMAKKFTYKQNVLFNRKMYTFDDCIQQIFVDLPYLDFKTRSSLYFSITFGTFYRSICGGIVNKSLNYMTALKSVYYDAPTSKGETVKEQSYLLDKFVSSPSPAEETISEEERERNDSAILQYLEKTVKSKRELNAIFCMLFTDLKQDEIKGGEYAFFKKSRA